MSHICETTFAGQVDGEIRRVLKRYLLYLFDCSTTPVIQSVNHTKCCVLLEHSQRKQHHDCGRHNSKKFRNLKELLKITNSKFSNRTQRMINTVDDTVDKLAIRQDQTVLLYYTCLTLHDHKLKFHPLCLDG
jgi:hypothetical protein